MTNIGSIVEIESPSNPKIKWFVKLQQDSRFRREQGLYVLEGAREFSLAQQMGFQLVMAFVCTPVFQRDSNYPIDLSKLSDTILHNVSKEAYKKIAYRQGVEGIAGVFKMGQMSLERISYTENALYLVLEKVEKPGNLGAIFRTADAAGVHAVFLCDPACDPFNPNAIRSSVGCVFTVPWAIADENKLMDWFEQHGVRTIATTPTASNFCFDANLKGPSAIVMGAEDKGLSAFWLNHSDEKVAIPMQGQIDSLNVSVSTAILLFEAVRQRVSDR